MKYFRKSSCNNWIGRLWGCVHKVGIKCHAQLFMKLRSLQSLGSPTCTCPRRSNERSQSLHLGRFCTGNGSVSFKLCKTFKLDPDFWKLHVPQGPPMPFWRKGSHGSRSSLAPKLAGFHHGQKPLWAPEPATGLGPLWKLQLCRFHFFTFSRLRFTVFCTWY